MERILMILFFVVVACKNTDDGRYLYKSLNGKQLKFIDGDDLVPPMPDGGLNNETLAGVDADGDGVRDDVEVWINEEIEIASVRVCLKLIAKNLTLALNNYDDPKLTYKYYRRIGDARSCMFKVYGRKYRVGNDQVDSLYEIIVNTSARIEANVKVDASLAGGTFPVNIRNPCKAIGNSHEEIH